MSRLTDLIAATKAKDPALGAELEREFKSLSSRRQFGLNFERHRPEAVELAQRSVRKGDKVRVLPPRGSTERGDQRLWRVARIENADGTRHAHLRLIEDEMVTAISPAEDVVVVAEFRDPIYPGLISTGRIERGGDKPFHTVINAENYHALKALTFTHKGKVDAIYIDPPYNTGAKDWRYNNDYVEGDDLYRHSKWLAFMERRLLLARELLKPDDSVLIVTIDEKEYLRLGLLLEQVFAEATIQMITSVINPTGTVRRGEFSRSDEYIFFVMLGAAAPAPTGDDMLHEGKSAASPWGYFRKYGAKRVRKGSPGTFYPLNFDRETGAFVSAGDAPPLSTARSEYRTPDGCFTVWPLDAKGVEMTWGLSKPAFERNLAKGFVRFSKWSPGDTHRTPYYLYRNLVDQIERGEVEVLGRDEEGAVVLGDVASAAKPFTTWNKASHSARHHGTVMLDRLLPSRRFPFPKSLYAVEDALRFFVRDKRNATIVDFFAGSGTTAHAVMRLNHQDDGRRQCISVTNNEVSADEQRGLRNEGLRPGDPDWEERGICEHVTKPRIRAALTGETPEGSAVSGEYKFVDEFPMAEGFEDNAEFFTLTYESPVAVGHNRAFKRIAPLLWLRAGARGGRVDRVAAEGWAVVDAYGVLFDLDQAQPFCQAMAEAGAGMAFVVTDDDRRFQAVVRRLPEGVEAVRLYESYLSNFRFASGE